MKHTYIAAAAAFLLALAGAAHAEGNGLAAVEAPPAARVVRGGGTVAGGAAEAYPAFVAAQSVAVLGGVDLLLPSNGSEGAVQTANSLPRGFSDGTVAVVQAQSVRRYLAERDQRTRLAAQHAGDAHRG